MTTGAIRRAKLQSNCHHQQTNTRFLWARWPSCRPTNTEGKALEASQMSGPIWKWRSFPSDVFIPNADIGRKISSISKSEQTELA